MALFDLHSDSQKFLSGWVALAQAATKAADAYAKSVEYKTAREYAITVNVNGDAPAGDVVAHIKRALNAQRVQDR